MARTLPYDLLAVDLDGTLLDSKHGLPNANRVALHRAHDAGMKIVLCTGRSYPETRPVIEQIDLDLDAAVTVFGAIVTDVPTERTLLRTPLPLNVARPLSDWLLERGFTVMWLNDSGELGFDGYIVKGRRWPVAVDRWIEWSPCDVRTVSALPADAHPPVRVSIIDEENVLAATATQLHAAFDGQITQNLLCAPAYALTIVEAFAPGVSKWAGIEWLCRRWNIDPRRTVAVGDDVNDTAMVASAGLGVAMANAHADVKRVAQRQTDSNDSGGVAKLIDSLFSD